MPRLKHNIWLPVFMVGTAVAWPAWANDKPPSEGSAVESSGAPADRFTVPDGTPQELIGYVQKLLASPPRDMATREKTRQAILQAAERILAAKPDEEELEFAVQAKMSLLQDSDQLANLADELSRLGHEDLARQVRGHVLQLALRKSLLGGPARMKESIDEAVEFLQAAPPTPADISLAFMVGRVAEISGDRPLAVDAYGSMAKTFAASKDAKVAEFANVLEGAARRMNLVGHDMKVEGRLLDGRRFDWSKYRGKVVLVDFWATWCGPCLREIPNQEECYDLYHDKGFDIVAVNLDRNLADVKDFVKQKKIPWPILVSDGGPSPSASYYGVISTPTTILVDRDGKVVSLEVRGRKLRKELEKLLGPADKKTKSSKKR